MLENALRMSGVALVRDRSGYRLVPSPEAGAGGRDRTAARDEAGLRHQRGAAAIRLGADGLQAARQRSASRLDAARPTPAATP